MSEKLLLAHTIKRESPRRQLARKLDAPRVLCQSISQRTVKTNRFDNVGRIHKKWTEAGECIKGTDRKTALKAAALGQGKEGVDRCLVV